MKQSVLEYKKLLEQEGLLVEFAEPEGKEGEDRPVTLVTYFSGGSIPLQRKSRARYIPIL